MAQSEPVVNDQLADCSGLPARSRTAAAPPVTLAVYTVRAARVADGFRTHWFVVPLRDTVAVTPAPVAVFFSVTVPVPAPWMASLNVTTMLLARRTSVAPGRGVMAVMTGAGPVVKVQLLVASGVPAASRTAAAPPVSVAVYFASLARLAVGFSVAVRVVAL